MEISRKRENEFLYAIWIKFKLQSVLQLAYKEETVF